MLYMIGDKIVYPMHGAGIIDSIEDSEVLGEIRQYYILKLPFGNMKLMIPVNNTIKLGIRNVIEDEYVPTVIERISEKCVVSTVNWNKRHRDNLEKLRSGDILEVADVYKFLTCREKDRNLSTGEKKMLTSSKQILFSELLLSTGKDVCEIEAIVEVAVNI